MFMYRVTFHRRIPNCYVKFLTPAETVITANTQSNAPLYIPNFQPTSSQLTFIYEAPKLWISIPDTIRLSDSLAAFKSSSKNSLAPTSYHNLSIVLTPLYAHTLTNSPDATHHAIKFLTALKH